jgi:sodium transport system ATP-binding protein
MIEIKNLTKTYKLNKKQMKESRTTNPIKTAVNDLTLTARKGEIYGLLGPNGAGKTTTLRCISTIIRPTKGEIYVDGHEVRKEPEKVREKIGFLTGDIKLDPQFSPDYMFDFFGKIHGVKPEKLKERKEELFTYFGIKDFAHKKKLTMPSRPAMTRVWPIGRHAWMPLCLPGRWCTPCQKRQQIKKYKSFWPLTLIQQA